LAADNPQPTPPAAGAPPSNDTQSVAAAIADITERSTLLIREEIELAKAEVTEQVTTLVKGSVVLVAAGVFAAIGGLFLLHGIAWFLYAEVFDNAYWGFFVVAGGLFVLGGIAAFLAKKWLGTGAPTPTMAIDEAGKIKEAFTASPGDRTS
jgi:hypothetical protein